MTIDRSGIRRASLLVVAGALLFACSRGATAPSATAAGARPRVLTVPELENMCEQGTPVGVIYGKIDSSGTIYRLTDRQADDLRASGMPASVISYMQQGYQGAIKKNPDLAKSNDHWTNVNGYWYGGLPYGWPREWVVNAPSFGGAVR